MLGPVTMFNYVRVLFVVLGAFCGVTTAAQANIIDLAVLSDKSAKITVSKNWKCRSRVSVTVETADASFFETRLNDLGMLHGAALSALASGCASLSQLTLTGETTSVDVIKGTSKKSDGWVLRLEQPDLTKKAQDLPSRIKSFDDLAEMVEIFAPYRSVPGIDRTSGYALFAQNSGAAVQSLLSDPARFDTFVETATLSKNEKKTSERITAALNIVQLYDPQAAGRLSQRVLQLRNAALRAAALRVVERSTAGDAPIKAALTDTHAHLKAKKPDAATLAEIDASLAAWIEGRVLTHEQANGGLYLDNARAHMDFVQTVSASNIDGLLPVTQTAVETTRFWFEALSENLLADNLAEAKAMIEASGTTYQEIDLILETGLALHEEFRSYGFEAEANELLELAKSRIETAIETGLQTYKNQLSAETMTLERVAYYKGEADLFYALAQDYPGFGAYVDTIEEGVERGQLQACAVVANSIESGSNRRSVIVVGGQSFPLKSLVCALYNNGHLLRDVSIDRGGRDGVITLLENNLDEVSFDITSSGEENAFWGVSDAWDVEMGALVIPPPSGKPDRSGVTECDLLAGDPNDKTLRSRGVVLEDVSADYDFDRAVEACIAAVEHDPDATRQVYQLARVLDFLGDAESAAHYAQVAAGRKYAPALHLQAFSILTNRDDDDAFFDAVDLLKVSTSLGYGPSKAELTALMPPGVELFRERPPPSDTEILDAVGRKRCESNIFAKACSTRTGVAKKSCFQTSENVFSCELVLYHRCSVQTGMDGDPLMRMFTGMVTNSCSPTTDPMFMKLTKNGNRWSARKEF